MKKLISICVMFIISGCSSISNVGMSVAPSRAFPGLHQCENKEEQRDIVSGNKPYWGSDDGPGSDYQTCGKRK
ncbi:hypothetical protein [Phytobacter diazotrophicus]|uniref:hypothetical protein n=1 Tax=Phytobacter diazotrophicus TaxID=395631 RepID=UPI002FF2B916